MSFTDEVVLELRHVTVRADDGHKILDDVSFTVRAGEVFGLVFTRGSGRSTLLRVAAGFFAPDEGEVLWRGASVGRMSRRDEIRFHAKTGFVFQNGGLLLNTSVYDNVALPLRYHTSLEEPEIRAKVLEALRTVGMEGAAARFPFELATFKQKLVTLARSLVSEPEIIYYDNFFKGSDIEAWQTLTRLVRDLRPRELSWLLVLEADPTTYQIADRLCILEDGKVIEVNAPQAVRDSKDVRASRIFRIHDLGLSDSGRFVP